MDEFTIKRRLTFFTFFLLLILTLPAAYGELISLDRCGDTFLYSQGQGANSEYVMENLCLKVEMRQNNYDPTTEVYDKLNDRYFMLMANRIEERNNDGNETNTTTLVSMGLTSDIDEGFIRWSNNNSMFGYELRGNNLKIVANLTNWDYFYADSELWLDMIYHKNTGDVLEWLPVIVDGEELPIETETRTAGLNTFIAQNIGRGYEIIIDPIYYIDYSPEPAQHYDNGDQFASTWDSFDSPDNVTSELSDGNTETRVSIEKKAFSDDLVLRVRFEENYTVGNSYHLRFYKRNNANTDVLVYPHTNDTTINTSVNSTMNVNGIGWFEVNVTELVDYMYDSPINHFDFRVAELTAVDKIEVSEIMLRSELPSSDAEPPVITNCTTNTETLSCGETARLSCTITDNSNVAYATFTVDNNTYYAIRNVNNFYYDLSPTGIGNVNFSWSEVEACDLFSNCADTDPAISVNYDCQISSTSGLSSGVVPLTIWLIIVGLGVVFVVGGFLIESSLLASVGFLFIFIAGFIMQNGDLGLNTVTTEIVDGGVTEITKSWAGWDGPNHHLVGWAIMVVSMIMWVLVIISGGRSDEAH